MRILLLNAIYQTTGRPKGLGGAERSVKKIAESLVERDHQVEVVTAISPQAMPQIENEQGVKVYGAPVNNIYWFMDSRNHSPIHKLAWHVIDDRYRPPDLFEERIRTFLPDILHTNTLTGLTTSTWRIAKQYGIKIVHTLRDYYLLCPKCTYYSNNAPCQRSCTPCRALTTQRRHNTEYVDAVVGNSQFILDLHLKHSLFRNARIRRVIGSISEATSPLPPRSRADGAAVVFGYIGRITEEKGVYALARAFSRLPPDTELIIAGETSQTAIAAITAAAAPRTPQFVGFVSPASFYERVDIVVAPSLWHEPLPRSVVDAVAFGRPVIGSNRGGIPESMGVPPHGWIFDPAKEYDIDEKLLMAYNFVNSRKIIPRIDTKKESVIDQYIDTYSSTMKI